jgi:malate dehydrogenase (quinone)
MAADVAIIGAGVTGSALAYVLTTYTTVKHVILLEKEAEPALINSNTQNNSQTLHFGDIETNYDLKKAKAVKRGAEMVRRFLDRFDPDRRAHSVYQKMVLAVGPEENAILRERFAEFHTTFPQLRMIDREEITRLEPKVVEGRPAGTMLLALVTPEGYTVDYRELSRLFLRKTGETGVSTDIRFNTRVRRIERTADGFLVRTDTDALAARTVAVCAGAHSLLLAKRMGYGRDLSLLSVAGSFFLSRETLRGKVYTVQIPGLPFAAVHGDPEVHDQAVTRFGPTAKVLPLLERHRYHTLPEYLLTVGLSVRVLRTFFSILFRPQMLHFVLQNLLYDLPVIGRYFFIKEVRKVAPSLRARDLTYARGYGGTRPQLVDLRKGTLELGDAKIIEDDIIFSITPSPGASVCLRNAEEDAQKIVTFLGGAHRFDQERFRQDLVPEE